MLLSFVLSATSRKSVNNIDLSLIVFYCLRKALYNRVTDHFNTARILLLYSESHRLIQTAFAVN